MNKTYHFLAGLPRSGNTLLSALLNQNPAIYSTPISPVSTYMWDFFNSIEAQEPVNRNVENKIRSEIFLCSFLDNYYKEINKPVVIEREKMWGTPANLNLIKKYVTPNPKIIFTVRDILEILASFVRFDAQYLKDEIFDNSYFMSNYRSPEDTLCEYLMMQNGIIDKGLLSLASAFYPENKSIFHIVEYSQLTLNPRETMAEIYKFLEMPNYEHNFNKIEKVEQDNDDALGFPPDLHDVRQSLSQSSTSLDILSEYIKQKYSNMEFWRHDSLMKVRGKGF